MGMTRGHTSNRLHLVAANMDDAREQFAVAQERDRADRGLAPAAVAAQASVRGLATGTDGLGCDAPAPDGMRFGQASTPRSTPGAGLRR